MTVSGSIDFAMTAADVVTQARSVLGIQADEEVLEDHELQRGMLFLNVMLKAWQADGVRTWVLTEGTPITLVQGTASYTVSPVPFELDQVRLFRSPIDLEMTPMGRKEYYALPNKTSQGVPVQYYYERQRATATIYVWPTPDATVASLKYTYRRVINDVDASSDSLDLPQEWYSALIYGLAVELIPHYGKADSNNAKLAIARAAQTYAVLKNFDVSEGEGTISIVPASYGRWGR